MRVYPFKKQRAAALSATSLKTINSDRALDLVLAGVDCAASIGQPMCLAVVDIGGNLVAFLRMSGAWVGSVDVAQKKAWTSLAFDIETADLAREAQPGAQFFGIQHSNFGRVMIFAGGLPLHDQETGELVGAVGVSGGSGLQDSNVASAMLQAWVSDKFESNAQGKEDR